MKRRLRAAGRRCASSGSSSSPRLPPPRSRCRRRSSASGPAGRARSSSSASSIDRLVREAGEDHVLERLQLRAHGGVDARIGVTEQVHPPGADGIQVALARRSPPATRRCRARIGISGSCSWSFICVHGCHTCARSRATSAALAEVMTAIVSESRPHGSCSHAGPLVPMRRSPAAADRSRHGPADRGAAGAVAALRRAPGRAWCRSCIVVHGISLPPGEFGGPWIDRLFTGNLPRRRASLLRRARRPAGLGARADPPRRASWCSTCLRRARLACGGLGVPRAQRLQ